MLIEIYNGNHEKKCPFIHIVENEKSIINNYNIVKNFIYDLYSSSLDSHHVIVINRNVYYNNYEIFNFILEKYDDTIAITGQIIVYNGEIISYSKDIQYYPNTVDNSIKTSTMLLHDNNTKVENGTISIINSKYIGDSTLNINDNGD